MLPEITPVQKIPGHLEGIDFTNICPISFKNFKGAANAGDEIVISTVKKKWYVKNDLDKCIKLKTVFGHRFLPIPDTQLLVEAPVSRSEQVNAYVANDVVRTALIAFVVMNIFRPIQYYLSERERSTTPATVAIGGLLRADLVLILLYLLPLLPEVWRTSAAAPYQQLTKDDVACVLKLIANKEKVESVEIEQRKNVSSESTDEKSNLLPSIDKSNLVASQARGFFSTGAITTPFLKDVRESVQEESPVRQRHQSAP
jgi:hypothetical protein